MVKYAAVLLLAVGTVGPVTANHRDLLVSFNGGIGVHPVSNVAGTMNANGTFPDVTRNIVRGVNPPGQLWVIESLRASIFDDGTIRVRGRGLLLGGGNGIGGNANQSVFATLICEATAPFAEHSTGTPVPLDEHGDFRINDTLSNPPATCASPVLLIRSAGGAWFAAGIVQRNDDDD